MNEVKMKNLTRQNKLPCSLSKLYLNAVPRMAPEEVKRLVSSASKLIVAATSEISPEEPETAQELKRRETKSIKSFNSGHKEVFASTLSHESEGRRGKQNQTRQSEKDTKRKNKASNASSTSPAKSKRIFPTAAWNAQQKNVAPSLQSAEDVGARSYMPLKIRRQESSSKAGENVSSKNCPSRNALAARSSQTLRSKAYAGGFRCSVVLKTKEQQALKGNSAHPSAESTVEIYSNQHSKARKKIKQQSSSEMISRPSILKRASGPRHNQNDVREKLVKCTQSNGSPKGEQEGCDSLCRTTSKCHQVNFSDGESLGWERGNVGGYDDDDDDAIAPYPEKSSGLDSDCMSTVQQGPSFLHELCQEMTQDIPADRTRNESMVVDGNAENPRACNLLNQPFSLSEPRDPSAEDHTNSLRRQEGTLEESCKQEVICIPPMAPELPTYCVCEIKEEQGVGFPGETTAFSKSSDSEQSEEEFSLSSLSSSARSFSSLCEQMGENVTQEKGFNSRMETFLQKLLKAPEIGTTQQELSHQHEKQKAPDEKANTDHGNEDIFSRQVAYFSVSPNLFSSDPQSENRF
ncbi:uncharacterized protein LOC134505217 isoform X2 [Candoia aspera]